jgi:hypothetical protein
MCIFKKVLQVLSWVWFQYFCVEYFRCNNHIACRIHVFDSVGNPALPTLKSFGSLRADKWHIATRRKMAAKIMFA